MNAPLLRVHDASVGWGRDVVLSGLTFDVVGGDYLGIVGPNGAGKSTLLRAVLGLSRPLAGTVERSSNWRAGYVPQRESVEPLLRFRTEEVVAMAALPQTWQPFAVSSRRRALAREALAAVGLASRARRVFRDLSGGQRQRVMLARALATEPTVLVLDEPTNGLDLRAERDLLDLVQRLLQERGLACVLVSHALDVVAGEVQRVGLVHDGRMRWGPPADVLAPATLTRIYGPGVRLPRLRGETQ